MSFRTSLPTLLTTLMFTLGCGSDNGVGPGGDADDGLFFGSATMQVSGAIQGSYSGTAAYAGAPGVGYTINVIFENGDGLAMGTTATPNEGTYSIGSGEGEFTVGFTLQDLLAIEGEDVGSVDMEDGTVTITSFGNGQLAGSFTGTGEAVRSGVQVSASGEFVAVCPVGAIGC